MCIHLIKKILGAKIGVGLMVLQNFGGYNGISYYASETVVSAGIFFYDTLKFCFQVAFHTSDSTAGFSSGDLGTILMGAIQV